MNPQLIIALIIAAGSFGSAWKIQSWRYGAKETARAQQILVDQRLSAKTAIRRLDNVADAQNEAETRASVLRVDAVAARDERDRLRASTAAAVRAASASQAACLERATALSELLGTVAAAGGELAEKAGRHSNDVQKLMAAWPKE